MLPDVIKYYDVGDETPEGGSARHGPYETLVERLYAQALAFRHGIFTADPKLGFPNIGKLIDAAKNPPMPHPLAPIIGPLIDGIIKHKQAAGGAQPVSAPPSSLPPPPLTPPPTKSEPATDVTGSGPGPKKDEPPAPPAPPIGKGSKGPQGTATGHRKVLEKKRRLMHKLP